MKRLKVCLFLLIVMLAIIFGVKPKFFSEFKLHSEEGIILNNAVLHTAYRNKKSDIQVRGEGRIVKILKDDNKGSRHQRFILDVGGEKTVLIAHNIDLAPRVSPISRGDIIGFHGEYEWNGRGGVVHWTHRDPRGRHANGWLSSNGNIYQ